MIITYITIAMFIALAGAWVLRPFLTTTVPSGIVLPDEWSAGPSGIVPPDEWSAGPSGIVPPK